MPREGKEGLVERSRRIFGGQSQRTSQSAGDEQSTSKQPVHSKDVEESSYQRRREQVRRAQRNHRERKESYLKSLEREIIQLREQYSPRVKALEKEVEYLKGIIRSHGIQVPAGHASVPPMQQSQSSHVDNFNFNFQEDFAVASFNQSEYPEGILQLSRPESSRYTVPQPLLNPSTDQRGFSPEEEMTSQISSSDVRMSQSPFDTQTYAPVSSSGFPSSSVTPEHGLRTSPDVQGEITQSQSSATTNHKDTDTNRGNNNFDVHAAGVDFVLELEHSCASHSHLMQEPGNGHVLMASSRILAHAPDQITPQSSWQVPESTMEQLLFLSSKLDLEGEITPVQAWYLLRTHPKFAKLSQPRIEAFKKRISPEVKCFGFGAVVEGQLYEVALEELFASA